MPSKLVSISACLGLAACSMTTQQNPAPNDPWYQAGQQKLAERLAVQTNQRPAKNVIVFWADGVDVTLATVARIFDGQQKGESGESNVLPHETLPHTALLKTYSANAQIPASAATASAFMTGVKTWQGSVSLFAGEASCESILAGVPMTISEFASSIGKATGVITTTAVVDASPASNYAHAPRGWALERRVPEEAKDMGCTDIGTQLVASDIDVAFGGGHHYFTPAEPVDPETTEEAASDITEITGFRLDDRNLINEWQGSHVNSAYVETTAELLALDTSELNSALGLFSPSSMQDSIVRASDGPDGEPTLSEMTRIAIEILSNDEDGFFLFVETEESDDLQHGGFAQMGARALIELSQALATAREMVDPEDTLIILTGDHGHSLTFSGYVKLGNPVFGLSRGVGEEEPTLAGDDKPRTAIGYRDGLGAFEGERPVETEETTMQPGYRVQALIPGRGESHGGQDVPIFASGPWAHLIGGVMEQNAVFHIIRHAMQPETRN